MATIYLVSSGQYSDYHIEAAFSTREYADMFLGERDRNSYDEPRIEEYELDTGLDLAKQGFHSYQLWMARDGKVLQIESQHWPESEHDHYRKPFNLLGSEHWTSDSRRFTINAKSEEHAIKIANERRTQLLAFDKWEE